MLGKILKVTSLLFLIGVFVTLIDRRDFSLSYKKTPSPKDISTQGVLVPLSSDTLKKSNEISLSSSTQGENIAPAIAPVALQEIKKVNSYIQQNEGSSDTDDSYSPQISPCTDPIHYKIGSFDTRFGISKENFISMASRATSLWENAAEKKLFQYDPAGDLTLNLIYDERQTNTTYINNLAMEIDNSKDAASQLKDAYEQEKNLYTSLNENLVKDGENFQIRSEAYTAKVESYNKQGGASKIEYDAMMAELAGLQQEVKSLEDRRLQLLSISESINAKVARYNEFVVYVNNLIKKSNSLGAKKFTEGKFTPSLHTIDIYQYDDTTKLFRVLTHEFGHALGIGHNADRYSIMYSINSATTTTLSKEDIASLLTVCTK